MVPFVVVVVLVALFGILYVHIQAARSAFELAQIERTVRAKQDQNEKLTVTKAYLEAPERIRQEAIGRLRMRAPDKVHYLPGGEVSGAGTPTSDPDTIPQAPALPQP
ncbi:MAG: cell division protein FtsL, partial [Acidimicrobiia bacterium]|nr:cell division protein FtsL [Acidimicrobiia bacterium]